MEKYFAADTSEVLCIELESRITNWRENTGKSGVKDKWLKSRDAYFGNHFKLAGSTSSEIGSTGKRGEIKLVTINHYRNLLQHILIMTTNQKPVFDCRAINSDYKALADAKLGNSVLDTYFSNKKLGRYNKLAAEQSLVFGKGFVYSHWDLSLGKPFDVQDVADPETGEPVLDDDGQPKKKVIYEGDIDACVPTPFDVFVDPTLEDWNKALWVDVTIRESRWELMARYPQLADKIHGYEVDSQREIDRKWRFQGLSETSENKDYVDMHVFIHKQSPALTQGRMVYWLGSDCVLYDGPTIYKDRLPVFRIAPSEIFGTTEGYTAGFDLLSINDTFNTVMSTIFTNINAHGVQKILVPQGANISVEQVNEGLAFIKYNPGPGGGVPQALQLVANPADAYKFVELTERLAETISGVNSVARGNPDSSLKSGVALGLVQSMAIQFASGFQQSWAELNQDHATHVIRMFDDFATTERRTALSGKHNRGQIQEFSGKQMKSIETVVVDMGAPLSKTTAGRVQMADNLLAKEGMIKTPQEYLQVVATGNLDPMTEGPEATLSLIRRENELLMGGTEVRALVSDPHLLHMQEHAVVLADPELRARVAQSDPEANSVVKATLAHSMEHLQLYKTQDPVWSAVSGEPPAPQPMMAPPPNGGELGNAGPQSAAPMPMPPGGPDAPPPLPADAQLPPQGIPGQA